MVNPGMGLGAWRGKLFGSIATILVCLLFVLVGALPVGLAGQLKIRVDLVSVNVSVLGACAAEEIYCESRLLGPEGRDVQGSSADDFILLEEGVPHAIVGFKAASRPFQLVLVIDFSNPVGQVSGPTSDSE